MKFWEAMKALEEGKTVKCLSWEDDNIIPYPEKLKSKEGTFHVRIDFEALLKTPWEIYEEPPAPLSFAEVVKGLREGKRFSRSTLWHSHEYIQEMGGMIQDENGKRVNLLLEDFQATDWVEVKE